MKKALLILCALLLILCGAALAVYLPPALEYRNSRALMEQAEYAAALPVFERLGDYRDSAERAEECREALRRAQYLRASALYDAGLTQEALDAYREIADYRDSADWIARCEKLLEEARLETDYTRALALYEEGALAESLALFEALGDYADAAAYRQRIGWKLSEPGDTIFYGRYPQTGADAEPIEWLVLARDGDAALVVSLLALEARPFAERLYPMWEGSLLRLWLNEDFPEAAFTAEELARIRPVTVVTPDYVSSLGAYMGGPDTEDRLFLLSHGEIETYFPDPGDRLCRPSPLALEDGASVDPDGSCAWWSRSPGDHHGQASCVMPDGTINPYAVASDGTICVRPAMWIRF